MGIHSATAGYEAWLGGFVALHGPDVDHKHARMAEGDPFPFFRATYYRWAQHWAEAAGDLADAPVVLAVGDLHVENFATWRDVEGRLCRASMTSTRRTTCPTPTTSSAWPPASGRRNAPGGWR